MVKVYINGTMDEFIKETLKKGKYMEKVNWPLKIETH